jgi:antitoxin component YwqK of YwqJK toxin-antitoxin module
MIFPGACIPNGEKRYYYLNGNLQTVQNWKWGKRHGVNIDYYESGQKSLEIHYKENKIELSIDYYEDGDTMSIVNFIDGRQGGLTKGYYDNNVLRYEVEWHDGYQEGKEVEYFENGIIKSYGQNKLGVKSGEWRYYTEDGSLARKENWVKGKMTN